MKKVIALVLILSMFVWVAASAEDVATPTDLIIDESEMIDMPEEESEEEEDFSDWEDMFEDEDVRAILEEEFDPWYITTEIIKLPQYYGDTAAIEATLVNYPPGHIVMAQWEYSLDNENWIPIEGENELIYEFIYTRENALYWYRITVTYVIESNI